MFTDSSTCRKRVVKSAFEFLHVIDDKLQNDQPLQQILSHFDVPPAEPAY